VTDTFSYSSPLTVTAAQAWEALQDAHTWGAIAGVDEISKVSRNEDGNLQGYSFKVTAGLNIVRGSARTVEAQAPSLMKLSIRSSELNGSIEALLADDSAGSLGLTMTLSMRPKGLMSIMFYPVILQTAEAEFPNQVQQFADRLNTP